MNEGYPQKQAIAIAYHMVAPQHSKSMPAYKKNPRRLINYSKAAGTIAEKFFWFTNGEANTFVDNRLRNLDIIIIEYPFFIRKILFHNINRVKVLNKKRILAVFTMEEKKYIINLKAINYDEKEEFIKLFEDIAAENLKLKSEKPRR